MNTYEIILATIIFSFSVYIIFAWGNIYWTKRLNKWARKHNYLLLESRQAKFFEGPGKWIRTQNQTTFQVKVRDSNGIIKSGWIVFGNNLNPFSDPGVVVNEIWE